MVAVTPGTIQAQSTYLASRQSIAAAGPASFPLEFGAPYTPPPPPASPPPTAGTKQQVAMGPASGRANDPGGSGSNPAGGFPTAAVVGGWMPPDASAWSLVIRRSSAAVW